MASPAGARNPLAIALDVHHQGPPREGSDEPREPVAVSIRYRHFVHDQWEQLLGEQLLEAPDLSSHARQSQWRFQGAVLCLKDGLHDRGIGQRLPNRSARIGNAHEDRACTVDHQQGGGLRQMRPADKLGQPAKIQRPEEHVRPRAGTPSDRLREDDTALSGDPPDLVIADDERKPLPRRAKPGRWRQR